MSEASRTLQMLIIVLLVCFLWNAATAPAWATSDDTLRQIHALIPSHARSYSQICQLLGQLDHASSLVTLESLGQSYQGHPIWLVTATDPNYSSDEKIRLFIIARQHGTECAGTTATLALVQYLAESSSTVPAQLLRYFEISAVPVANPDGCIAGRRTNGQYVDLNRDWGKFTQPETQAIRAAILHRRPHAVIDLHELPEANRKLSYSENFIETIGNSDSLPKLLCANTIAASHDICYWMKAYGYPLNVYYDYPGDSLALCHRYWGLNQGIPSFLCESKTGGGRSLPERAGFHLLAILGIINYLGRQHLAPTRVGSEVMTTSQPLPPPPTEIPLTLTIRLEPVANGDNNTDLAVCTQVEGSGQFGFVAVKVDGTTKLLTTQRTERYLLDTSRLSGGQHYISAELHSKSGTRLATQQETFPIPLSDIQVAK